jgi:hypothetical protein
MARIAMEVPHTLGKEKATSQLKEQLEKRRDEIEEHVTNLKADWTDDELAYSFSTYGFNINGNLVVDEGCAKVLANVPLPALMFRGRIEKLIQDELGKLLSPEAVA